MPEHHRPAAAVLMPKMWRFDQLERVDIKHTGEASQGLCGSVLKLVAYAAMFNRDAAHGTIVPSDQELLAQAVQDVLDHVDHLADVVVGACGHAEQESVPE